MRNIKRPTSQFNDTNWAALWVFTPVWTVVSGILLYVAVDVFFPPDAYLETMYSDSSPEQIETMKPYFFTLVYGLILGLFVTTAAPILTLIYKYRRRMR